jgi:hypothetical protein
MDETSGHFKRLLVSASTVHNNYKSIKFIVSLFLEVFLADRFNNKFMRELL